MMFRSFLRILVLPALLTLSASSLIAQGIVFHEGNWLSALEKAEQENKLIFLDAYTTWCGPCKMMDKQTFVDSAVGVLYNRQFINVKMTRLESGRQTLPSVNDQTEGRSTMAKAAKKAAKKAPAKKAAKKKKK